MQVDIFQGHNVRTEVIDEKIYFALADVCAILEIANVGNVKSRLKKSYIRIVDVWSTEQNRSYPTTFVNERGLIRVLQTSRSPLVESFQDWADERVEQLMRGKTVNASGVVPQNEDALILDAMKILSTRVEKLQLENAELKPKAKERDDFMGARGSVSVGDAAKLLTRSGIVTGEKRLFDFLDTDAHWTSKNKLTRKRRIMQSSIERGLLEYKAQSYEHPKTGERIVTDPQIRVTPKGLHKLRELLLPPMDIELLEVA